MKIQNTLIVYTTPRSKEQKLALATVKNALEKHKLGYEISNRNSLDKSQFKGRDMIIAIGGDGTFLRAAQFIGTELLFGVNSDVKDKEGFFMKSNRADFEGKLNRIISGRAEIKKLPRLEAHINSRRVGTLALNEFFIGQKRAYNAAKYAIQLGGKKEMQKSSGVLVTTPAGSYAWAKSCCSRTMPLNSKDYQFVVREPYEGTLFKNYRLKHGTLRKSDKIAIISQMLGGVLVADSVSREYNLKCGDKITVRLSSQPLSIIWF